MSLHAFLQAAPELSTKLIQNSDKFEAPQHHASSCLLKCTTCEPTGNVNMFCSGKQKGEAEVEWNPADSIGCSACRGGHRRRHVTGCACLHALPTFEIYILLHTVAHLLHCCMHRRPEDLPPDLLKMHYCVGPVSLHREEERV